MTHDPDVAIIGAGAAGIAAARRLAGSGLSAVVLEALPRIGGRAWTRTAAGMPLDLGCGWLHSADRNPWTRRAEEAGFAVDRRTPAWRTQYHDLGFPPAEQQEADRAFTEWIRQLAAAPPASDTAAHALEPGGRWTSYLQAMSGFISGDELERVSARDFTAYDTASTGRNWRLPAGYGTLVTASLPAEAELHPATPVQAITLDGRCVALRTPAGTVRARAAILTVSTSVLTGGAMALPAALDPWREAAARLPLGCNEKLFLEIVGDSPFEPETHVLGDPHDATTGSYYIRPFGWPVIECFLGGAGARAMAASGPDAAFARAIDQLVNLFGATVRRCLRPLVASHWTNTATIGGAYSHALPGQADARAALALPFDGRLFFAGEATHATDFSTAHGAYASGLRAADEAIRELRTCAR
ncbi:flavin monoamine oxidase family protein [Xanthobacter wiegelii]|uniref:flavin monoamine oxidase family protein n=1 Tax=Xanthobacter wiegelii TaxID=3119913 RepID=UPI00372B64E4